MLSILHDWENRGADGCPLLPLLQELVKVTVVFSGRKLTSLVSG